MGAYLSEPITNKETEVEENDELRLVSASMQGWRVSQEDAHNAIINFDNKTSLFAVYDGHGGHEVAEYTAKKLPAFIKQNVDYQKGNIEKALIDAFVDFDRTIIKRDVVAELKRIAGKPEDDIEDEEEVDNLYQEATMPIEEVIAKYEANEMTDNLQANESPEESTVVKPAILKNPHILSLAGSSEPKGVSPFLRAKAAPTDKSDLSAAKEIDFVKSEEKCDTTNGVASKHVLIKEKSSDVTSDEKGKNDKNGELDVKSMNTKDHIKTENGESKSNALGDKQGSISGCTEFKHEGSNQSNGVIDESSNNQINVEKTNGTHNEKKAEANGEVIVDSSKGKGKGKGKGKSSIISNNSAKDVGEISVQESNAAAKLKRAPRSAAELYQNILHDDGTEENDILDEDDTDDSDEDVVYGQDDSESDEVDEEDVADDAEEEEEDEQEDSEEEDAEEENDNGEDFIGGEFNEEPGNDSGCTAVVALLRGNELFVANAGDSRCVVCRDGKAIEMSFDHKPEDTPERNRIETAGGRVTPDGRVNGGLNLSRAIGDHAYKTNKALSLQEQMISPVPDIRTLQIDTTKDSYIVLACDGIWNSLTSQEVVDFVSERLDKFCTDGNKPQDPTTQQLQTICEELFEHCLAPDTMNDGTGMDNMTAVIVKLRPSFEGNKSAKNCLPVEGSSSTLLSGTSSSKAPLSKSSENETSTCPISLNGDAERCIGTKRSHEISIEESSGEKLNCNKKAKLDDRNNCKAEPLET